MIFPISLFEGQFSTLICWFLIWSGYFNLRIVFAIILAADIACDNMYYWIGRWFFRSKHAPTVDKSNFLSKRLHIMKQLWHDHPARTMVLGKNAYIISVAIVASAGMVKMPYHRFLMYSIPAAFVQPIVLLFIWYNLWSGYALANTYIQYPGIIIAIIMIIIMVVYRHIGKRVAQKFDPHHKPIRN